MVIYLILTALSDLVLRALERRYTKGRMLRA
jgi:ABC-type arginine transport system permease subunit